MRKRHDREGRSLRRGAAVRATMAAMALFCFVRGGARGADEPAVGQRLAQALAEEHSYDPAAVEYRRLALSEAASVRKAGFLWAAAYEYEQMGDFARASGLLDRTEELTSELTAPSLLLRGEAALKDRKPAEAAFYFQSAAGGKADGDVRRFASRRLARAALMRKDVTGAEQALRGSPADEGEQLAALDRYAHGHDKRPWLGGVLGMIPGLGYAYSREYANALRSLILNGIFIFGMVDTARDDQWGGFSAITFFELTWYTGSIYGGVDAAHRRNRERLEDCMQAVDGNTSFAPDLAQIPIVSLRFSF